MDFCCFFKRVPFSISKYEKPVVDKLRGYLPSALIYLISKREPLSLFILDILQSLNVCFSVSKVKAVILLGLAWIVK